MMAGGVDPAAAFLAAAGITDPTITAAINTLVNDLVGYGIWNKMLAIYPFVGGTAATHKFNLKDPQDTNAAFRLAFAGGWTHSANGALPNGTNAYAETYINTFSLFTPGNGHFGVYSRTIYSGAAADLYLIGNTQAGVGNTAINNYLPTQTFCTMGGILVNFLDLPMTNTAGFFQLNNLSGSQSVRRNATSLGSNTNTSGVFPNRTLWLAARNTDIGAAGYSAYEQAFASVANVGLTNTELANYYTAVQAFQTTLGRQV